MDEVAKELTTMKHRINDWPREEIKKMMLLEAIKLHLHYNGQPVQKFSHIGAAYAKDSSLSMHELMHQVIYSTFKHQPGWAKNLEETYMKENNIKYKTEHDELENHKGFIEIFVTEQYNEVKCSITDHAKKIHGCLIRLHEGPRTKVAATSDPEDITPTDEITSTVKQKKNPTVVDEAFIRILSKSESDAATSPTAVTIQNGSTVICTEEWDELLKLQLLNKELEAKLSVYKKQEHVDSLIKEVEVYKDLIKQKDKQISKMKQDLENRTETPDD